MIRIWCIGATLAAVVVGALPGTSWAQAAAKFKFEGVANCHQPKLNNYIIRGEGTGKLSTDRTAELKMLSNVEGISDYRVKLGDRPTEVSNGTAQLRVSSARSLRATREYPNNFVIVDLKITRSKCIVSISQRLKPGKRDYTFQTPFGIAYCDKPVFTKISCDPI